MTKRVKHDDQLYHNLNYAFEVAGESFQDITLEQLDTRRTHLNKCKPGSFVIICNRSLSVHRVAMKQHALAGFFIVVG